VLGKLTSETQDIPAQYFENDSKLNAKTIKQTVIAETKALLKFLLHYKNEVYGDTEALDKAYWRNNKNQNPCHLLCLNTTPTSIDNDEEKTPTYNPVATFR
jgi:hypothetical protein